MNEASPYDTEEYKSNYQNHMLEDGCIKTHLYQPDLPPASRTAIVEAGSGGNSLGDWIVIVVVIVAGLYFLAQAGL